MKKLLKNLFFFSAVGSVAILASCGGDDEPVLPPQPSIEVEVTGVDITGTAISAVEGETATFAVTVDAPGGFNTVNVTTIVDGAEVGTQSFSRNDAAVTVSTDGTEASFTFTYEFDADDVDTEIEWEFEAVDDSDQTATTSVTATVEAAPVEVVTHEETLIGGQLNATTGSFYNAVDNEVYSYTTARDDESANVDFLFFFGETNQYSIASIDDDQAAIAFNAAIAGDFDALGEAIFETRNETRFKATDITAEEFDAIENVEQLLNEIGTDVAAEATLMNSLEAGDVFAFTLAEARGSRMGLVKVVSTAGNSGTDRAITIQVKIEPAEE